MTAPLDPREAEKPPEVPNDSEVLIKPEGDAESAEKKKKGTNGFLVSLAGSDCFILIYAHRD